MRFFGFHRVGAAIVVALLMPIAAEAATCSSLRAELASLERKGGKSSSNVERQLRQLEKKAQKGGCFRGLFAKKNPSCGRILNQLQRLKHQNLRASNRGVEQRRASVRNAIARSCGHRGDRAERQPNPNLGSGGYRTLCVRSCDGYYFPINFSAGRDRFKIDDAYCKQLYGDGRAELFIHRNSEDSQQAVSLDGKRKLADQPFAFAYRASYNPACAAELNAGLSRVKEVMTAYLAEKAKVRAPAATGVRVTPLLRPVMGQDPETLANRSGEFVPGSVLTQMAAAASVRTVGPTYYYQESVAVEGLYRRPVLPNQFTLSFVDPAQADSPE